MSKRKIKIKKDEPLFFMSFYINGMDEKYHDYFDRCKWVRLLNVNHQQVCEQLDYISQYSHLKNSDGSQVVGEDLTILPSEMMEMEMDVNEDYVKIKDNRLVFTNSKTKEEKIMELREYLFTDHFISTCWEPTKDFDFRKSRLDRKING